MLVLLPEAGQETACQLTPVAVPMLPVRPSAAAAGRLRSRCPDSGQVAHSSMTVAMTDLPWKVICTHMPQKVPCPNVPIGNAAKKLPVKVLGTVSTMPDGQNCPLLLPVSDPQYPQKVLNDGQPPPLTFGCPSQ